jgi:hypothetical protein
MTMAKHAYERGCQKHTTLLALLFISVGAIVLASDRTSAQIRPAATGTNPPERTNAIPDTPTVLTSPAIDKTAALGQALAACNQGVSVQEAFTLPGLKGEVALDRCYKGRAHLICVVTALAAEATSLVKFYRKVVDAKYADLTTVAGVCEISPDTMVSDLRKSEEFAKRFTELKSQYEAATKCVGNVEQTFKNVSLADLTKAPEVLQSITDTLDSAFAELSKTQDQTSALAAKMELSNKALKQVIKVQHAMCMNTKDGAQPRSVQR